jgi:hypothetical protein
MRTQIAYPRNCAGQGLALAAVLMIFAPGAGAQSGNSKSQLVYLPDPTPRAIDPHLLLHDNPQAGTPTQEALERRNAKRRELVAWAANELVTLSEQLHANVTKPKTASSIATATANADKIEQLAKNLTAALKTP